MNRIRILSQQDVLELMTIRDALLADEKAYCQKATGAGSVWPMVFHEFEPGKADLDIKSGDLKESGVFGFKLVSWFGTNPQQGLPELFGTSMLFDIQNGKPIAVINAGALTGMRTGAAAAVGAKYLARADASSLLMVGTGMLASYAIAAILLVCPQIQSVSLANPHHPKRAAEKLDQIKDQVDQLLAECGEKRSVKFESADNLAEAAPKAHIIVTATPSRTPIILREWVMPGTHISCLGADMAGKQELDSKILADASVFLDDIGQSVSVGECEVAIKNNVISEDQLSCEIGEVISGTHAGRRDNTEITVFDSSGIALQDLACCSELLAKAVSLNKGALVDF